MAVTEARFDSTAVRKAKYDAGRRVLDLWYEGGEGYSYFDVSPETFERLLAASSAGEFVNLHIKPHHDYRPHRRRFRPS